ncbi:MAG: hypothetical protein CMI75_08505 [Candidatus Pelagibacter sp.]|nr:hypothetical protein [Candidatus Pelagibacter sp.]
MALTLHGTVSDNTVALDRKTATPLIINGDMRIAQRGDQTGITSSQYINVDRFFVNMINLGTWSFTQSTDTPTGLGFASSLKIDCTTADASPAAADNFYLSMQSEGQNLQVLEKGTSDAKTSTLAYWIKSNKTGNYVVELWDRTNDRHVGVVKTISSANTWEKHICNIPADTSGALANTNARSIMVSWAFDSGSNFTSGTLPSAWQARVDANRFVGTNLGLGDNTANEVLITGVQWEVGTYDANSIPAFQFEDVGTSLARCQRYYFKISSADSYGPYGMGHGVNSTNFRVIINTPVTMRAQPTLSFSTASNFIWSFGNALTGITSAEYSTDSFSVSCNTTGVSANGGYLLTAGNNSNSYIEASSEL